MESVSNGYFCSKCHAFEDLVFNTTKQYDSILNNINYPEQSNDKVYTLANIKTTNGYPEQTTILIDEINKTVATFWTDGFEGASAKEVKGILDFVGIKYNECEYTVFPEKYLEGYKEYDWRNSK